MWRLYVGVFVASVLGSFWAGVEWERGAEAKRRAEASVKAQHKIVSTYRAEKDRVQLEQDMARGLSETIQDAHEIDQGSVVFDADRVRRLYRPAP